MEKKDWTDGLFRMIEESPVSFQTVDYMKKTLLANGFLELKEGETWEIKKKQSYFVTRNDSSMICFRIPDKKADGFHLIASHTDSPSFKIKANPEITVEKAYVKLNVEKYGGMIMSSWFDRPLSIAGRVFYEEDGKIVSELLHIKRNLLVIPNLAIHMNREINQGYNYNPQVDLLPILTQEEDMTLYDLIAKELGIQKEQILSDELFLYVRQSGTILGAGKEWILSPRLDDLQCAYAALQGILGAMPQDKIALCAFFDNEEVGSGTKQGADSDFLEVTLERLCMALGLDAQERYCIYSNSLLLSADNAHALHPNHPEKCDLTNRPKMNRGIVLKYHGAQKYTTDGYSSAFFIKLCKDNNIPYQTFLNRSDLAGGSTLGNISTAHVSIPSVDIGFAQLAMHSAVETAGRWDLDSGIELFTHFFQM